MTKTDSVGIGAADSVGSRPRSIKIVVGYAWAKGADGRPVPPRQDQRWQSIKGKIASVSKWVETMVSRRGPSLNRLDIRIERLRGSHGQLLLDNLRGRIESADILIMDIGSNNGQSFNPNVLLETGMAIVAGPEKLRNLFVLKPVNLDEPSDLKGFLFTGYAPVEGGMGAIKLLDDAGFHAALRSVVISIAYEREMIGPRRQSGTDIEGEGDEDPDAPIPHNSDAAPELPKTKRKTTKGNH